MTSILQPWQLMFLVFAGWVNRQQQEVIEYLRTENQVLKEKLGKKRILLNDDQRRRLGVKGKILGRKLLEEFSTLFTGLLNVACGTDRVFSCADWPKAADTRFAGEDPSGLNATVGRDLRTQLMTA